MFGRNHEPPEELLLLVGVLTEHDEADRGFVREHRAEPGARLEVPPSDRDRIRSDITALFGAHVERADRPDPIDGDFAQRDLGLGRADTLSAY